MTPFEAIADGVCPDLSDSATAHSTCRLAAAEERLADAATEDNLAELQRMVLARLGIEESDRRDWLVRFDGGSDLFTDEDMARDYHSRYPSRELLIRQVYTGQWEPAPDDAPSEPPVELERGADAPSSVATFEPGWLSEQIAKSKATLDGLPPDLRASLGKPGPERGIEQGGAADD